jgi:hypothetical protein
MAVRRKTDEEIAASTAITEGIVGAEELETSGTDIVRSDPFDRDDYANIGSMQDAMALARAEFGDVILAHEDKNLGTGFRVAEEDDKFRLIKVPLFLLDWRFNTGDYAEDYVSIHAVQEAEDGSVVKWIINDGGTGICRDLREYTRKTGRKGAVFCRRGLRVSEYDTILEGPEAGKPAPRDYVGRTGKGKTFYLDFSA